MQWEEGLNTEVVAVVRALLLSMIMGEYLLSKYPFEKTYGP